MPELIFKMNIVYILTNESMPDYIKIGMTGDLDRRLKELHNTSIPFPFECFYACRVDDARTVEKRLHEAFGNMRVRNNREFFEMLPEQAYAVLELLSKEDVTPKDIVLDASKENAKEVKTSLENAKVKKRSKFKFQKVGISIGAEIFFSRDRSQNAKVASETNIEYNGKETSLSKAARKILGCEYDVSGSEYWGYEDPEYGFETLDEIRKRFEEADQ